MEQNQAVGWDEAQVQRAWNLQKDESEGMPLMDLVFPHKLAVVAILKDEAEYVGEWLDYHIGLGVTKFYLYDNGSEDGLQDVLAPYIACGIVDCQHIGDRYPQLWAYNDAVKEHRFDCKYMAFIDLDEFICPCGEQGLIETVEDIFSLAPGAGGITMNWRCFGSSGHVEKEPGKGVLERFLHRAADGYGVERIRAKEQAAPFAHLHVKSIVNPRCVDYVPNPHHAYYFHMRDAVDEDGKVVVGPFNARNPAAKLRVNHYITKSKKECLKRRNSRMADNNDVRSMDDEGFAKLDERMNDVFDDGILRWAAPHQSAENLMGSGRKDVLDGFSGLYHVVAQLFLAARHKQEPFSAHLLDVISCFVVYHKRYRSFLEPGFRERMDRTCNYCLCAALKDGAVVSQCQLLLQMLPDFLFLMDGDSKEFRTQMEGFIDALLRWCRTSSGMEHSVERLFAAHRTLEYAQKLLRLQRMRP